MTRKQPDTHRSKKGPKLYPVEKESKSRFKEIKKYVEEAEAEQEIKDYKRKK